MKYHFKVHKEKGGYWAEGVELPFAKTQADTEAALAANMKEVLEMFLDDHKTNEGLVIPLPRKSVKGRGIVEVSPDPKVALAFLIRRERQEAKMSQREAAHRMGIKHVSQYQKLESGKSINAELGTLKKLKDVFPSLSVDSALA